MPSTLLFPDLIDCHVHFREPGNTEAEDMASGAKAAASGGVMTVCDMPNTEPPTCTVEALRAKLGVGRGVSGIGSGIDIRFFFGATTFEHLKELKRVKREDIVGVKIYFDHSTGNQKADTAVIEETFKHCSARGIPVVCHCEDAAINQRDSARPPESEEKAIRDAIALTKKYGTQLHIAHLSTVSGLELVRQAKIDGLPVTCEATPHHLFMTVEDAARLGTLAKMNPPLRTHDHVEALWQGIADGTVDCIASDHAPHTLAAKHSASPPGGVPGVETMLPLLLTAALTQKSPNPHAQFPHPTPNAIRPEDIVRLLFTNPNRIFHLGKKEWKGGSPEGGILIDPDAVWTIRGKDLHSKCGWTPYEGWEVRGKIVTSERCPYKCGDGVGIRVGVGVDSP